MSESPKKLYLVRGLPGSGRSTLAKMLAGQDGVLIASEDELPYSLSPLTPAGIAHADLFTALDLTSAIKRDVARIVIERIFHRAHTMHPFARLGAENGYDVVVQIPHTDWANDPAGCLERTSRKVDKRDMDRIWRAWETAESAEAVFNSISPSERVHRAKELLAKIQSLRARGKTATAAYAELNAALSEDFSQEVGYLHYLGYFDPAHTDRVDREYAVVVAEPQN